MRVGTASTLPLPKGGLSYIRMGAMENRTIRIGTRGSQMALAQTGMVVDALRAAHPGLAIQVVEILTSGDWKPADGEVRLMESKGGKGLFAHEIEQRILAGEVDCGVHSLKDMPSFLPEGLEIRHFLARGDARDAYLSNAYPTLDDMPAGAVIGTSSLRRTAFVLRKYPHLKVVSFRGNAPTRVEKLDAGQVDGIFLGVEGLKRVGLAHRISQILEPEEFLPACGQSVVCIETRRGDEAVSRLFEAISCPATTLVATAERAALQVLDGSCHTPIGAYATLEGDRMVLSVAVASVDGLQFFEDHIEAVVATVDVADRLGRDLGSRMKAYMPDDILR